MGKQKQDKKQTINQFCIYDIQFNENIETNAFAKITAENALKNAHKLLDNFLRGNTVSLFHDLKRNGDQTSESVMNDMLSKHKNVYLLRINNHKHKNVIQEAQTMTAGVRDFEEKAEPTYPYCYVVIDNRPNKHFMAIQKNSAFGDPNNVRKIIEHSINLLFQSEAIPIEMHLYLRTRPSKIWEFCKTQCDENGDAIKCISFTFPNQKKTALAHRIPKEHRGIVRRIAQLADSTEAIKTLIKMDYAAADAEQLEKHAKDFSEIIHTCKNTSYNLKIQFRDYGNYNCDEMVKAMFPMHEELISAFRTKWQEVPFQNEFGLVSWCDNVYLRSYIYKDHEKTIY